jgi:O-antigen/teichoic acid export membrane protein
MNNNIIHGFTPSFISQFFQKRKGLRKIAANSGWLIGEKIYGLGVSLLVGVLIARYLGPENFGMLSYAFSIIGFLGTFVYLGLSGLVVREIVQRPDHANQIMGSAFVLKLIGSVIGFLIILGIVFFSHSHSKTEFWLLIIIGVSLIPQPFLQTINYWFQSQIQSKYYVLAIAITLSLAAVAQIILVLCGASIIAIAIVQSLQVTVAALSVVFIYHMKRFSILRWEPRLDEAIGLLKSSWIIILSGFLAFVNLKIDQIMLRWMVDAKEVGIYAVAVKFSEVWYFIPAAIMLSAFPKLIETRKNNQIYYEAKQQQMLDVLFSIALCVAILTTLFAKPLISLLFGNAYIKSSSILVIHIWAGIFMFMRAFFSKWVFIENELIFSLISHGAGAVANVSMNFLFIPLFQGYGAALATLISYAVSSYLFLFLSAKTRPLALKMSKSIVFPIRLVLHGKKVWSTGEQEND